MASKIIQDTPLRDGICPECKKPIRQRRIKLKSKIDTYRIWVHQETRRTECGTTEEINKRRAKQIAELFKPHRPDRHTEKCTCPNCQQYREETGI